MPPRRRLTPLVLVGLALLVTAGLAAGSPQPTPMCAVCDAETQMWGDERWAPPDESHVRLRAHANGSATWTAELRWEDPGDAPAPGEASMVESAAREELATAWAFPDPKAVEAEVREGETTIRWRTPGAVDRRFGHDVLRGFHGEGTRLLLTLEADSFVIEAPTGSVITNEPEVGHVSEDRTTLTIDGPRRSVDTFHVVFGEERTTMSDVTTTLAIGSILWPISASNALSLVVPPSVVLAVGFGALYALGRRMTTAPDRFVVAAGIGTGVAAAVGVALAGTFAFVSAAWALAALASIVVFGYAAAGSRRWTVAGAALAYLAAVGPMVVSQWPLLTPGGFFVLSVLLYTVLTAGFVVLGVPGYLFGLSLARRGATA